MRAAEGEFDGGIEEKVPPGSPLDGGRRDLDQAGDNPLAPRHIQRRDPHHLPPAGCGAGVIVADLERDVVDHRKLTFLK